MAAARWEEPPPARRRGWWLALVATGVVLAGWVVGTTSGGPAGVLPVERDGSAALAPSPGGRAAERGAGGDAAGTGPGAGWAAPAPGWTRLPHSPLLRRHGHSAVWTGREAIVWGGVRSDERVHRTGLAYLRSGATFDPASGAWRRLEASPLTGRTGHVAAWSGDEMLVWGGWRERPEPAGGAYDPVAARWRTLPPGPVDAARFVGGAWTGEELLVWGVLDGRWRAAAYRPATGWRRVPPPPLDVDPSYAPPAVDPPASPPPAAAWAGGRLVVWLPLGRGSLLRPWDPTTSTWGRPLSGPAWSDVRLLPAGDHVLVLEGARGVWRHTYDVRAGTLRDRPGGEVALGGDDLVTAWAGDRLLAWDGARNETRALDPADGRVAVLEPAPLEPRGAAAGVWTDAGLLVWGGASPQWHYADGALLTPRPAPPSTEVEH